MEVESKRRPIMHQPPPRLSARWRWIYRGLAVTLVPLLVLELLEGGLRIFGYGFATTATVPCQIQGKSAYCDNDQFSRLFFPHRLARPFTPFAFAAKKSAHTYRIFVLGASAAQGIPEEAFCFGRMLQVLARDAFPEINFEVITAAITAINSHAVLPILQDCVRHEPDLFVIYLGHNEVVGPYGPGTIFSPLTNLKMIRAGIAIKSTCIGQLLMNLAASSASTGGPRVWEGMAMFLEKQVRADDSSLAKVYGHFAQNLTDMCQVARANGSKVILSTVGTNEKDHSPFASQHRSGLTTLQRQRWDTKYEQGIDQQQAGQFDQAAVTFLAAAEIDDTYAELHFLLGRCYWSTGQYEQAKTSFARARDLDTLRFRADSRINAAIRTVAERQKSKDVYLVDSARTFEQYSPHGICGSELFYEHVHLNFAGNYILAKTIFEQLEKILPAELARLRARDRPVLSAEQCSQHLAYTDWDRYRIAEVLHALITQPPFTNQHDHEKRVRYLEQELTLMKARLNRQGIQQSAQIHLAALARDKNDWQLHWKFADFLTQTMNQSQEADRHYRFVHEALPHYHKPYAALALTSGKMGKLDEAVAYSLTAIRKRPVGTDGAHAHSNLALIYKQKGQLDKAMQHLTEAIQLDPHSQGPYYNLGVLLYEQGQLDEAIDTCRKGIHFAPQSFNLHFSLGIYLKTQGHDQQAIKSLKAALGINPNATEAKRLLEELSQQGR